MKNKSRSYLLATGLAAGLAMNVISGCNTETRTELSDILHEDAKVTTKQHTSHRLYPIMYGKILIMQNHNAKNIIKFNGKINFEINNEEIYNRFNEGDIVDIFYKNKYKLTFKDINKDGTKELVSKVIEEYEFVDAQLKNKLK